MPALTCSFGPLVIEYDERVLTPRPWTLAQAEWAAELSATAPPGPLLELCAGAGHIGLAAAVRTGRALVPVEADPVAASYAVSNAARAGAAGAVEVRTARLATALRPGERFALVLADPPYLRTADTARWPADPRTAIDGGPDGLDVVRECLSVAAAALAAGGALLLQVAGPAQAAEVAVLAQGTFRAEAMRVTDPERAVQLLRRV
ncbi:MAG TPA: RsmD family RNA methyltransferase [Jatrophihabitans sp.]|nr:RsmD family RNA methyltransferase [Jatrophihabitans sp.]